MTDKLKNIVIGFFVLFAILITIATVLFIQPSIGDGKKILNVKFSNIAGINKGTRVSFAGKPIGEVQNILPIKNARKSKKDSFGRLYAYLLKLKVDSSVEIYDSDIVTVQTTGLMGEKSIGIIPIGNKKTSKNITDQILYAKPADSFENTAEQIAQLSEKAEKAVDNINNWFEHNSLNLSKAVKSISNLFENIDNKDVVSSFQNSLNSFTLNMQNINQIIQKFEDNQSFEKVNILVDNIAKTSEYLNTDGKEILENIKNLSYNLTNSKHGLGKLLNSNDLYLKVDAIMTKANTLFDDVNNYGILFQYSKSWQRLRTKRENIMYSLNSAKSFKNFFDGEISEIATSLSRINRLMKLAETKSNKTQILKSSNFKRNLKFLLKQVDTLHDMIKLYNENLVNLENKDVIVQKNHH